MMRAQTVNDDDKPTVDPKLLEAKRNEVAGEIQRMSNRERLEKEVQIAMKLPIGERLQKYQNATYLSGSPHGQDQAPKGLERDEVFVEDVDSLQGEGWIQNTVMIR